MTLTQQIIAPSQTLITFQHNLSNFYFYPTSNAIFAPVLTSQSAYRAHYST